MFEKEAKECFKKRYPNNIALNSYYVEGFNDGYNKANEWHCVKDGLPIITKIAHWSNDLVFLTKDCNENITKHFGYFNFRKEFEEYNTDYKFILDKVIAWKEIVLPELPKEN